ncbi:NAD(P)-dependent oxidoreductase [Asticcacaulis sp. BYS171W]|uniref:NAD(P)-dependent oxidoreductase n=1 Tax=Asticcacaulis aquaticus TaxID=2984212 RepID=A0ABT5HUK4_9CAUL|nr:NAD(P)-dependent oxidoreductase [Asticcacaulis aquaticus]MDC7683755.1 NAD(P)-dependent oxidoreductase [Asticcacaulis aquaticus]
MSLIIASQLEPGFNDNLRRHASAPTVIEVPDAAPWDAARQADVLLIRPGPSWKAQRQAPKPDLWPGKLKWVYSASTGVDFYPDWLLDAPLVTCGRGVAADEIADYVLSAIYHHAKNLEGARVRSLSEWRQIPLGRVSGSTVGIIGFGAIGQEVARRALALGAHVTATRRRAEASPVAGVRLLPLEEVVASADHIVLALPATRDTQNLINARVLNRAKPTAHLINIARGSVLDQAALVEALDAGRLAFATLDVTEPEPLPEGHPIYTHPKIRLTPHISSNYLAVRERLFDKVSDDLSRFVRGEAPSDIVDAAAGY